MTLEAIRYSRGSLELLDQRLLPSETVYLKIKDISDAWHAIKNMVVRGAPAIAVTAALALALDLNNNSNFDSAAACSDHISSKLEYLISSRPTAVNIKDTANKLTHLCKGLLADGQITIDEFNKCIIEYCENMLKEDVKCNRKIGSNGADAIMEMTGKVSGLKILTHCNTGSLATAGYGTALGIVRTLNEQNALEKIYFTETRPYNQGSRLTAYEIVHDSLPGVLICDSAAASLLYAKDIDAVVVGADRVTSNGDTANKIGTLSLATVAAKCGIPFFVAAPTTSIDLTLSSGSQIKIEMRDPDEIKRMNGVLMAPEGIEAWNPGFDITPSELITGIVTENNTIFKSNNKFEMANNGIEKIWPSGFVPLTESNIKSYIKSKYEIMKRIGPTSSPKDWMVREVGDGNINYVFVIEGPSGSVVIKQALEYIRVVKDWKLTQDRVKIEAMCLKREYELCPEYVPEIFYSDPDMCLIVMHYIKPPHIIMRKGNIQGILYHNISDQISDFLAKTLFYTSLLYLSSSKFRTEIIKYSNPEMCKITEQMIFYDAYYAAPLNAIPPELEDEVALLHNDNDAKNAILNLRLKFMSSAEALIHGDLHCGSLMVTEKSMFVIDSEFAFYGPMGFDIGKIIGNLLLAYFSLDGHATNDNSRKEQRCLLLNSARDVWVKFSSKFLALWSANIGVGDAYPSELLNTPSTLSLVQNTYMKRLLSDSIGYCAASIIRRLVTLAKVAEMQEIPNKAFRAVCQERALKFGRKLLVSMDDLDMDDLVVLAEKYRNDGRVPFYSL